MSWLMRLRHILRSSVRRRTADAETIEELTHHIEQQTAKHVAAGRPPDEARRLATLELGGTERWRQATADARRGRLPEQIASDIRYALRGLVTRPGFTIAALTTIAVGVGSGATMIAMADGALLRPLPFPNADRAMSLVLRMPIPEAGRVSDMVWSYPKYELLSRQQDVFEALAPRSDETLTLFLPSGAERVPGETVGPRYFGILGVSPELGRTFAPDEDRIGGDQAVVVISEAFWRVRLGATSDVLSQSIDIAGVRHRIIGVMPPGFAGLSGDAQLWIPIHSGRSPAVLQQAGAHNLELIGLRAKGVTVAEAIARVEQLGVAIDEAYPEDTRWGATAHSFSTLRTNATIRRSLQVLSVAAGLLVFIVCVNLTTLLLTRGAGRRVELAVRLALGSTRVRLSQQLITESLVLAVLGGVIGALLASVFTTVLASTLPVSLPRSSPGTDLTRLTFGAIRFDARSLMATAVLSVLVGLVTGVASALRVTTAGSFDTLRRGAGTARDGLMRTALVTTQVAMGLAFLVAGGVTLESLQRLTQVPLGWRPEGLLAVRVALDPVRAATGDVASLWAQVAAATGTLPGVTDVAIGSCAPIGNSCEATTISPVGLAPGRVAFVAVTPGYFDAVGTRVLRGRDLLPTDTGANRAALVNESAARALWGSRDPLVIPVESNANGGGTIPVVGIVEDARYGDIEQPPQAAIYMPFNRTRGTVLVRTDDAARPLVGPIAQAVREAGRGHAPGAVQPMTDVLRDATVRSRLTAEVFTQFAIGALLLAAVGVYGTLALAVVQRGRELAIRRALGATSRQLVSSLGSEAGRIATMGIGIGLAVAIGINRVLAARLYDVRLVEPRVFLVSGAVLLVALAAATVVPVLRSLRINPRDAMRSE